MDKHQELLLDTEPVAGVSEECDLSDDTYTLSLASTIQPCEHQANTKGIIPSQVKGREKNSSGKC